jgi:hypothetical protein
MILSIYCSELSVDDEPPEEHTDEHGFVFVRGMEAVNSKGALLFSVSGSDEFSATINNVQSYTISKGIYNAGYVTATMEEDYGKKDKEVS